MFALPVFSLGHIAFLLFTFSNNITLNTAFISYCTVSQRSKFRSLQRPLLSSSRDNNNNNNNNIENNSAAAGAIFGGLIGGPFGLLFGAQLGASFGRKRAAKDEMERLGLTPEMLAAAEECGVALNRAMEGLAASRESLDTLQKLAVNLNGQNDSLYKNAQEKIQTGDEDEARKLLLERQEVQDKLKKTLLQCAEEKNRMEKMQKNVSAIEERGLEIEALLKRSVGAKAMMDTSDTMITMGSLRLEEEDPLLKKFRDLENS